MEKSMVYVNISEKNYEYSYAIVDKFEKSVIIILKDRECAIYDYEDFLKEDFNYKHLLLKYYSDSTLAYKDFMKLIGKMCKKSINGKYFKNHIDEDNSMIFQDDKNEYMLTNPIDEYKERKKNFINYIKNNKDIFTK